MARTGPLRRALTTAALTLAAAIPLHAMTVSDAAAAALVTTPVSLTGAHWIWYPEGSPATDAPVATRYLRRTFTAPAGPYTDAQLVVTGDDTADVWLNGTYLAGSDRVTGSWANAGYVDLAGALRSGSNTLVIAARTVGGVAPAAPGYQKVLIAPKPGGGLTTATSDLTTDYGQTRSSWSKSGSTLTLQVIIPPNATATVRIPSTSAITAPAQAVPLGSANGATSYALPSGSFTFTTTA